MKKTLCMLLAVLLLLGCFAACGGETGPSAAPSTAPSAAPEGDPSAAPEGDPSEAPEGDPFADMEEITLIYSTTRNDAADQANLDWLDVITEATGGKVVFDRYMSNSLVSSTRDIPDAVTSGICDISVLNINNYPNMFPLNYNLVAMPFAGITNESRLDVMDYMYANYPELEEEFTSQGFKILAWSITNANNLGVQLGKEYTSIEDIVNVKINGSTDVEMGMLGDAGAVPVTVAFPEVYQSLEKSVIAGFTNHSGPAMNTGWSDHIDNWVEMGEGKGICNNLVVWVMSLERWDALPDAVKEVFESTVEERDAGELQIQLDSDIKLKEKMESEGKYWVTLNDEQVAEWQAIAEPYAEEIMSEMEAAHPGFTAMYEDFLAQIATY